MQTFEFYGIDTKNRKSGNIKVKCPKCAGDRKNKSDKSLSVNIDEGVWNCHYPPCSWSGGLKKDMKEYEFKKKEYTLPKLNNTELSDKMFKWFKEVRKIGTTTIKRNKITESSEWMPQEGKNMNCINFNYFRDGILVNTKFRDGKKNFKMVSGAELVFYGLDDIKNTDTAVIVEGEVDKLAFEEAGILNVISVPAGASKGNLKLEYLDNCWEYFDNKKKIYLATDDDESGIALREELARRLGKHRCVKVKFPKGEFTNWEGKVEQIKDANGVLISLGPDALADCLKNTEEYPIEGVMDWEDFRGDIMDFYENGIGDAAGTGMREFDTHVRVYPAVFTIINGIPNQGKTSLALQLVIRLSIRHGWITAIFCPENMPVKLLFKKVAEYLIGKPFFGSDRIDTKEINSVFDYVRDHFVLMNFQDFEDTLDDVLEVAKTLVFKRGINALLIDPWNTLNHTIPHGKSETTYVDDCMKKINIVKKSSDLHIFLGTHPTKMSKTKGSDGKETGRYIVPTLYDIAGSASFFNKVDIGLTIYTDFNTGITEIHIQKMKFEHMGKKGMVCFLYNPINNRYYPEGTEPDNRNWIECRDCEEVTNKQALSFIEKLNNWPETKERLDQGFRYQSDEDLEQLPF